MKPMAMFSLTCSALLFIGEAIAAPRSLSRDCKEVIRQYRSVGSGGALFQKNDSGSWVHVNQRKHVFSNRARPLSLIYVRKHTKGASRDGGVVIMKSVVPGDVAKSASSEYREGSVQLHRRKQRNCDTWNDRWSSKRPSRYVNRRTYDIYHNYDGPVGIGDRDGDRNLEDFHVRYRGSDGKCSSTNARVRNRKVRGSRKGQYSSARAQFSLDSEVVRSGARSPAAFLAFTAKGFANSLFGWDTKTAARVELAGYTFLGSMACVRLTLPYTSNRMKVMVNDLEDFESSSGERVYFGDREYFGGR
jgi:hypothetical protein